MSHKFIEGNRGVGGTIAFDSSGTGIAARNVAVFGTENERQIAKAYGADVEDEEPEPIGPVECYRCEREMPRVKDRSMWCGQMLTPAAMAEVIVGKVDLRFASLYQPYSSPRRAVSMPR